MLYTLKQKSITSQVIALTFLDRSKGIKERDKPVDWLDFVFKVSTLGNSVGHRGNFCIYFQGAVRLPIDPSTLQKKTICVHMPHPNTEMGPILLQSVGKRCSRRFGWQRAEFVARDCVVGQSTGDVGSERSE